MQTISTLRILILLVLVCTAAHAQWQRQDAHPLPPNYYIASTDIVNQDVVWALADTVRMRGPAVGYPRVLKTTDGGLTWDAKHIPGSDSNFLLHISALDALTAWVTMNDLRPSGDILGGLFKTTDGGESWEMKKNRINPLYVHFFDAHDGMMMSYQRFYISTDGGESWQILPSENFPPFQLYESNYHYAANNAIAFLGDTVIFGTSLGRVYCSTDRGNQWTAYQTCLPDNAPVTSIAFRDAQHGIAVSCRDNITGHAIRTEIVRTSDGGRTWEELEYTATRPSGSCIAYIPGTASTYMMVADHEHGQLSGAAYSTDDGSTWTLIDDTGHNSIAFLNPTTGWTSCVTASNNLTGYMQKWSGPALSIGEHERPAAPTDCTLSQNYPNPFNPATEIEFSIPENGLVQVVVFDLLGREVKRLVDETKDAGSYTAQFDGSKYASGFYVYRLNWKGQIISRRMTLLK